MTNQQILEKAIAKAIDGGYYVQSGQRIVSLQDEWITYSSDHQKEYSEQAANLIFNHDFAKALWGDDGFTTTGLKCSTHEGVTRLWQYHLQQMVIADDPIQYLAENI